jgi:hypothetical protein
MEQWIGGKKIPISRAGLVTSKKSLWLIWSIEWVELSPESYPLPAILEVKSAESCPLVTKVTLKVSLEFFRQKKTPHLCILALTNIFVGILNIYLTHRIGGMGEKIPSH